MLFHEELVGDEWNVDFNKNTIEISKEFKGLPDHEFLRIEANFHFISCFWKGQAACMKINNDILWVDHHEWSGFFYKIFFNLTILKKSARMKTICGFPL